MFVGKKAVGRRQRNIKTSVVSSDTINDILTINSLIFSSNESRNLQIKKTELFRRISNQERLKNIPFDEKKEE